MPKNRKVPIDRDVGAEHTYIVDYVLSWDVSRSDDYNSLSCFGLSDFVIRPYIIYESCHSEYREVARIYPELLEVLQEHLKNTVQVG